MENKHLRKCNKRKADLEEESDISTCSIQLKTPCVDVNTLANSFESVSTDCHVLISCCSSNDGSSTHELAAKENLKKAADLEEEENKVNVQELMATSAGDSERFKLLRLESSNRRLCRCADLILAKQKYENELQEFFSVAEKNLQKQFIDKYNFDIVKDEPLEGRFEWVHIQLKP